MEEKGIDILREGIISKANVHIREKAEAIPLEIWEMDRDEVEMTLNRRGLGGTTLDRVRYRFWKLATETIGYDGPIKTSDIVRGICTPSSFYSMIADPMKLRWLLEPVIEVVEDLNMLLEVNLSATINKIMRLPDDPKSLRFKYDVLKDVSSRVYGSPTQTINQKSLNVSLKGTVSESEKISTRLKELESKNDKLSDPFIIDV